MHSNWICLALVAAAWWLGHATGYRLCKLRVKNKLKKDLVGWYKIPESWRPSQDDKMLESLLRDVAQI